MSLARPQEAPRGAVVGAVRMATQRRVGGGGANSTADPGEPELLDAAAARASLSAAWPETTSGGTAAPWGIFWEGELQRLI